MDAPSVIALEPRHLEAAVALLEAQLAEHEMAQPADVLRAVTKSVLSDSRHGFMLLALAGDRPVGIAYAAAHLSAEHGGTIGWLEELYVLPEWRARGVGSALLKAVMARAQRSAMARPRTGSGGRTRTRPAALRAARFPSPARGRDSVEFFTTEAHDLAARHPRIKGMDSSTKDKIEGKTDQAVGAVKEKAGQVTGNEELEAKGIAQNAAGHVEEKIGDVKKVFEK